MSTLQCLLAPYLLATHLFPDTLLQRQQRQHHTPPSGQPSRSTRSAPSAKKTGPKEAFAARKASKKSEKKGIECVHCKKKGHYCTISSLSPHRFTNLRSIPPHPIDAANNNVFYPTGLDNFKIDIPNGSSSTRVSISKIASAGTVSLGLPSSDTSQLTPFALVRVGRYSNLNEANQ